MENNFSGAEDKDFSSEGSASKPKNSDNLAKLAQSWLKRFAEKGLSRKDSASGSLAKDSGSPYALHRSPVLSEARPVQLDKGQVVWLQPISPITPSYQYGPAIKVFDKSSKSDSAITAALTIVHASPIDPERVELIIPLLERLNEELAHLPEFTGPPTPEAVSKNSEEHAEVLVKLLRQPEFERARLTDIMPAVQHTIEFIKDLLRYYRPGFDELPRQDQIALIKHQCRRINEATDAFRKVMEFAEYGTPKGTLSPGLKDATRDVKAAELRHIRGLSLRQVAEHVGEPPRSKSSEDKNDYPTTRQRITRGEKLVEQAFGEGGMQKLAERFHEEIKRVKALDEKTRQREFRAAITAEMLGIPLEQAMAHELALEKRAEELGVSLPPFHIDLGT